MVLVSVAVTESDFNLRKSSIGKNVHVFVHFCAQHVGNSVTMSGTSVVRIEPLSKDNYDTWKMQMEAILVKNDAWEYVKGNHVRLASTADN